MTTFSAYAIAKKPSGADISRYEGIGLVLSKTVVLLVEAASLNAIGVTPLPGGTITWGGTDYAVRDVAALNPTGEDDGTILYQIAATT